ncbi:hypothetical protein N4G69_38410 [Streptomyces mirabilis]|uniref:hypothetical protein n=1 Tax=Streptomyces mirabilis TaxID=68239 RepID=UPI0021BFDB7E|nr:hypothetical protein [Streptomyces mirabilis]MCT9111401.1 hypothetical protein [Streptomyces mirabilis]
MSLEPGDGAAPTRLGFGDVGERAITEGIATIGDLLADARRPGRVMSGQDLP